MRITNSMMMKRYSRNLNTNLKQMNDTSNQIATGRRFMKGSEDPVRALKALQVRRRGDALEQFNFNIENAEAWLSETEVAVMSVKNAADKAYDLFLQGANDPLAVEDRQIIATALRSVQEQLLKDLNTMSAGKYVFGGSNTKEVPFVACEVTGQLWYNVNPEYIVTDAEGRTEVTATHGEDGWNVFQMSHDPVVGLKEFYEDEKEAPIYWDLTGEFQMDSDPDDLTNGEIVNKSTLFDIRTPGIQVIGTGPNNLYNLIGRMAIAFDTNDMKMMEGIGSEELFDDYYDSFFEGEFKDYLVGLYPDTNSPNDEYNGVAGNIPGNRPYTETVSMFYNEDYFRAFHFDENGVYNGMGLGQRLQIAQQKCIIELTKVGEKANYVEYLKKRNEDTMTQMETLQNTLEVMPADEAILHFKMEDYVYKACLQMSSYIIQPSLMSFLGR